MEIYLNRTRAVVPSQALIGPWEISPNIRFTSSSVLISILIFAIEHAFCLLFTWLYRLFFNLLYSSFISFIYLASILISEANAGHFLGTASSTQSRHKVSQQHLFTLAHQCPFGGKGFFFEKKQLLFFYEKNLDTDFEK